MGAIMFGNGLSGIATNLLAVFFKIIIPENKDDPTHRLFIIGLFYFVSCAIFMIGSGYLYNVLMKNEYYIFQKKQSLKDKPILLPEGAEIPETGDVSPMLERRIEERIEKIDEMTLG